MARRKGIEYLRSVEKLERDAARAARLVDTSRLLEGPVRRLLSRETGLPPDATLWQDRVVVGGRKISVPKLYTLPPGDHNPHNPSMADIHGTRDPRAGKYGSMARRWGLDELPQVALAAAGEMWLVGPRPLLQRELPAYEAADPELYQRWQELGAEAQAAAGIAGWSQYYRRHCLELDEQQRRRVMRSDIHWLTHASPVYDDFILSCGPLAMASSMVVRFSSDRLGPPAEPIGT